MLRLIAKIFGWIGRHWAVSLAVFLIAAITATAAVMWNLYGKEKPAPATIYVTITGLEEGLNMENRALQVHADETIYQIFNQKNYPQIYEEFGRPLIVNYAFHSLMGVRAANGKRFSVKIDGTYNNVLTQAYVHDGAVVEIEYGP